MNRFECYSGHANPTYVRVDRARCQENEHHIGSRGWFMQRPGDQKFFWLPVELCTECLRVNPPRCAHCHGRLLLATAVPA